MKDEILMVWVGVLSTLSIVFPVQIFAGTNIIENPKVVLEIIQLGFTFLLVITAFVGYSYYVQWKKDHKGNHHHDY